MVAALPAALACRCELGSPGNLRHQGRSDNREKIGARIPAARAKPAVFAAYSAGLGGVCRITGTAEMLSTQT